MFHLSTVIINGIPLYSIITYSIIITGIVFCPGPMTLFAMATSVQIGPKRTLPGIIGGSSAYLSQMILTALGLGLVFQHSLFLFEIVKWFGVAYLLFLGIKQWRSAPVLQTDPLIGSTKLYHPKKLYLRGFFVGLSNPKSILIFTALFPQFLILTKPQLPQYLTLGAIFLCLQAISCLSYTFFGAKFFGYIKRKQKEHWQKKITGSLLFSAGLALATIKKSQ